MKLGLTSPKTYFSGKHVSQAVTMEISKQFMNK